MPIEGEYATYAGSGPKNCTTQGRFEDIARDRVIIGDKASVNPEIARNRESSNAAAELGLLRFAHGKPGRAPLLVVTMTPPRLLSPQHVVLDPHRILPYCVRSSSHT